MSTKKTTPWERRRAAEAKRQQRALAIKLRADGSVTGFLRGHLVSLGMSAKKREAIFRACAILEHVAVS